MTKRKGIGKRIRKAVKRATKTVNRANRALHKASRNRFVKAARRATDYGLRFVPVAGNLYAGADQVARGLRAAKRGKLNKFLREEAVKGVMRLAAPQVDAALNSKKAQEGVVKALVHGKGPKGCMCCRKKHH